MAGFGSIGLKSLYKIFFLFISLETKPFVPMLNEQAPSLNLLVLLLFSTCNVWS